MLRNKLLKQVVKLMKNNSNNKIQYYKLSKLWDKRYNKNKTI